MKGDEIIYQLSIEDIQAVAKEMFERNLNEHELKKVSDKFVDFVDWYDAIEKTIKYLNISGKESL